MSNRFEIHPTRLEGLSVIQRRAIGDERGFLSRLFCSEEFPAACWTWPIRQINHTATAASGTVRGMHFQLPPKAEAKLVSCIRGAVWDVAVDLRKGSPTFLQWHAEELSSANLRAMLIPPGFAHGFQTLEPDSELIYLHSEAYDPALERGLTPSDPSLAIPWPLDISNISQRDAGHPMIDADFSGVPL
jgi:dTDP-4-dehydrorhamnose 3,5-epimerase